jgi:hypothetical protein
MWPLPEVHEPLARFQPSHPVRGDHYRSDETPEDPATEAASRTTVSRVIHRCHHCRSPVRTLHEIALRGEILDAPWTVALPIALRGEILDAPWTVALPDLLQ